MKLPTLSVGSSTDSILVKSAGVVKNIAQPAAVTRTTLNVNNTDNTSDLSKPLSTAAITALNGKVPTTRTITINGVAYDLSANRTWTIPGAARYTISELTALTGSSTLQGFLQITDVGREGLFYVDPLDATTTADNGVVFVTAGGQRVKRIYNGRVNLAWFGLVNDDVSEASSINQYAIFNSVFVANRYGTYYVPKGTYWLALIDQGNDTGIDLPSHIDIEFHPEAKLRTKLNSFTYPCFFRVRDVEDVTITGGQMYGNRYFSTEAYLGVPGVMSDFGFGISCDNVINFTCRDTKFYDFKADGIYMGGSGSIFLNPTSPVTQTMTGVPGGKKYRVDVVGTGSVDFTYLGTSFATVTASTCRHITIPNPGVGVTIVATVTGTVTFVSVDPPNFNFLIDNVEASNNRRNGITVITGINWTISNSKLHNSSGTLPQAGIDLEPNTASQRIWNGRIINCDAYDNATEGFIVTGNNISLIGCNSYNNAAGRGYWLANAHLAGGDVTMTNCTSTNDHRAMGAMGGKRLIINGFHAKNSFGDIAINIAALDEVIGSNISVLGSAKEGLELASSIARLQLNNVIVDGAGRISGVGINVRGSNAVISNFRIVNCGFGGLSTSAAQTNVILTGGYVGANARTGITLSGTNSILSNSIIENNSVGTSTYYNVDVVGTGNHISNNTIKKGASNVRYAIRVNSTATGSIVQNNDVSGGGNLGDISDLAVGTVYNLTKLGRTPVSDADYTQVYGDELITYTALGANRAVTFLAASLWPGKQVTLKDESGFAGTNNITIIGTVDGTVNPVAVSTNYGSKTYYSNGTAIFTK